MSQKKFMSYGDAETVFTEYANAIKSLDPEGGNLDTRLTAVENELYSHFTINAYNATVIKISGFKANASLASGETFVLRQRGAEAIILTFGNNTQDTTLSTNYRAVRLYSGIGGTSKITNLQFDYANRDLYVTVGGFGALSFSQIGGQKDTLTYETGATVPETDVYNIPIVDIATSNDLDAKADAGNCPYKVFHSVSVEGDTLTYTMPNGHYQIDAYYYGGLCARYVAVMNQHGNNGGYLQALYDNAAFTAYSITVANSTGVITMRGTTADAVTFIITKLP